MPYLVKHLVYHFPHSGKDTSELPANALRHHFMSEFTTFPIAWRGDVADDPVAWRELLTPELNT